MGKVKEFGFNIARLLFEGNRSIDYVTDLMSVQLLDDPDGGLPEVRQLDPEWLREQVKTVKLHPAMWGYTYRNERGKQRLYIPINFSKNGG